MEQSLENRNFGFFSEWAIIGLFSFLLAVFVAFLISLFRLGLNPHWAEMSVMLASFSLIVSFPFLLPDRWLDSLSRHPDIALLLVIPPMVIPVALIPLEALGGYIICFVAVIGILKMLVHLYVSYNFSMKMVMNIWFVTAVFLVGVFSVYGFSYTHLTGDIYIQEMTTLGFNDESMQYSSNSIYQATISKLFLTQGVLSLGLGGLDGFSNHSATNIFVSAMSALTGGEPYIDFSLTWFLVGFPLFIFSFLLSSFVFGGSKPVEGVLARISIKLIFLLILIIAVGKMHFQSLSQAFSIAVFLLCCPYLFSAFRESQTVKNGVKLIIVLIFLFIFLSFMKISTGFAFVACAGYLFVREKIFSVFGVTMILLFSGIFSGLLLLFRKGDFANFLGLIRPFEVLKVDSHREFLFYTFCTVLIAVISMYGQKIRVGTVAERVAGFFRGDTLQEQALLVLFVISLAILSVFDLGGGHGESVLFLVEVVLMLALASIREGWFTSIVSLTWKALVPNRAIMVLWILIVGWNITVPLPISFLYNPIIAASDMVQFTNIAREKNGMAPFPASLSFYYENLGKQGRLFPEEFRRSGEHIFAASGLSSVAEIVRGRENRTGLFIPTANGSYWKWANRQTCGMVTFFWQAVVGIPVIPGVTERCVGKTLNVKGVPLYPELAGNPEDVLICAIAQRKGLEKVVVFRSTEDRSLNRLIRCSG